MLGLQILMEESIPNKIQEITVLLNFALFSRKPLAEIKSLKWWMSHPIEGIAAAFPNQLSAASSNRIVPPLLRCGAKLAASKIFSKRLEFRRSYSPSLFLLTVKHSYHLRVFSVDTKWYFITYIAGQKLVRGGWIARRHVLLAILISNGKS